MRTKALLIILFLVLALGATSAFVVDQTPEPALDHPPATVVASSSFQYQYSVGDRVYCSRLGRDVWIWGRAELKHRRDGQIYHWYLVSNEYGSKAASLYIWYWELDQFAPGQTPPEFIRGDGGGGNEPPPPHDCPIPPGDPC